ncbi:MAG: class I SAM-dependent methyltransferase [Pseudomonadales bacterium]|nr:class I SAM-dependent methyltransferase [Pseudomonadales bacterium]
MATHQEIAGVSDEDLVKRMLSSHADRFDEQFWAYFAEQVAPALPEQPVLTDLGCGPGLLLRDLSERYPTATMSGFDITPAMIEHAQSQVTYAGKMPQYEVRDIAADGIPLQSGSVHLTTMVAVLHVLANPFTMLAEIRRILAPDGIFLLQDWIRTPMPQYLDRMIDPALPEEEKARMLPGMLRLFPAHNKYTTEDWLWVLDKSGFTVVDHRQLRSPHFSAFVCRPAQV